MPQEPAITCSSAYRDHPFLVNQRPSSETRPPQGLDSQCPKVRHFPEVCSGTALAFTSELSLTHSGPFPSVPPGQAWEPHGVSPGKADLPFPVPSPGHTGPSHPLGLCHDTAISSQGSWVCEVHPPPLCPLSPPGFHYSLTSCLPALASTFHRGEDVVLLAEVSLASTLCLEYSRDYPGNYKGTGPELGNSLFRGGERVQRSPKLKPSWSRWVLHRTHNDGKVGGEDGRGSCQPGTLP